MDKILENKACHNLSLADATYLRWYEITNALSHTHIDAIFSRFREGLHREVRKTGNSELPDRVVIRCFKDATQEVASMHALRRFESAVGSGELA